MRLNNSQKEKIKKDYGVDRIWSFSQLSTFENCPWEYKMKYVDKKRVDNSNVYTDFGTFCHDTVQDFYEKKVSKKDLPKLWANHVEEWENDPFAHQFTTAKVRAGYLENLKHYFSYTDDLVGNHKIANEKPVLVNLERNGKKYIFVGYIDTIFKDENGLNLLDYKTSSKSSFSGAKLAEKSMQLQLYAIGEHQRTNMPYEEISCKFDMMKYCTVHFKQENGKWNTSNQERSQWVLKMEKKLKTKLKKAGFTEGQQDALFNKAVELNSLNFEGMPKDIAEQFYITNYLIDLDISEEACDKLSEKVMNLCDKILEFEALDEIDMENYLELNHPYNPNDYYEKNLCAYHTSQEFKDQEIDMDNSVLGGDNEVDSELSEFFSSQDDDLENIFV